MPKHPDTCQVAQRHAAAHRDVGAARTGTQTDTTKSLPESGFTMPVMNSHPDIFSEREAEIYLHLDGPGYVGVFAAFVRDGHLRARPLPNGTRMFWREDLDTLIKKMFQLDEYADVEPPKVGGRTGSATIYFLYCGDELVYIGQSIELNARLYDHRKTKQFDRHVAHVATRAEVDEIERGLIAFYKPRLNVTFKNYKPDRYLPLLRKRGFLPQEVCA
jgi:hypothetical protein